MERIKITGVVGRVAFTAARNGIRVPYNKEITVPKTLWIERRLAVGDIREVKDTTAAVADRNVDGNEVK
jgi:hypothetical protein